MREVGRAGRRHPRPRGSVGPPACPPGRSTATLALAASQRWRASGAPAIAAVKGGVAVEM